jgi:S-phase kinase-associated protein 1
MSVTLVALKDGSKVEIDKKSIRLSGLLKNLLEEYKDDNEISIPEIDGDILKKIVIFLEHYKDKNPVEVPKPLPKYDIRETYGEWDDNYLTEHLNQRELLLKTLEAANYIDCKSLLELICSKIAIHIKDLPGKEICDYLGLEEDLTDEEAKKIIVEFEKEKEIENEKIKEEHKKKIEEVKKNDTVTEENVWDLANSEDEEDSADDDDGIDYFAEDGDKKEENQ